MLDPQLAWRLRVFRNQVRCEAAAQEVLRVGRAILARMEEAKYRPDQPRAPRSTPIGGQRIDDPNSVRQEALRDGRVQVAQARDAEFYLFDFEHEYRAGRGHTWPKHIGRTRTDLINYLNQEYRVTRAPDGTRIIRFHPAESSFRSTGEASFYVAEVLRQYASAVEAVVDGTARLTLTARFGFDTGIQAFRANEYAEPIIRPTYAVTVVIAHDDRPSGRGYYVVTAFPTNDVPDEVVK